MISGTFQISSVRSPFWRSVPLTESQILPFEGWPILDAGCSAEQGENLAPCFGLQFFGRVDIDGRSGVMTVTLKDVDNRDLWSVDIEPRLDARTPKVLAQHS